MKLTTAKSKFELLSYGEHNVYRASDVLVNECNTLLVTE